ncbi:MAG: carboxypeptidase-like regulatory domain-containing protein [Dehalococcoidales bacterium]|nr:carboxypeptidase-like regulatory domain-containing protein [Dehalococcoidales bacterium]
MKKGSIIALGIASLAVFFGVKALSGKANLYGRVTDANTNQPIGGVLVIMGIEQVSTNSDGDYAFVNIKPGSYAIQFRKDGYQASGLAPGIILQRGNNELNFTLSPLVFPPGPIEPPPAPEPAKSNLYGRVTSTNGQPVAGARVLLAYDPEPLEAMTSNTGDYQFSNFEGDIGMSLTVMARGYQTAIKSGFSLSNGNNEINIVLKPVTVVEPSQLLLDYQVILVDAVRIAVSTDPNRWVMVPGYGLQYAGAAISQLQSLMIQEAINIGLINSSAEAYFDGAIMYHISGDTLAPYWWLCPYGDGLKFRSPAKLQAHIDAVHQERVETKATITQLRLETTGGDEPALKVISVTWRNDSPFVIQGRIYILVNVKTGGSYELMPELDRNQDALVSPGESVETRTDATIKDPWDVYGGYVDMWNIGQVTARLYQVPGGSLLASAISG